MFPKGLYRCVLAAVSVALVCLVSAGTARAQELSAAYVAVLLPLDVVDEPVCIVFDGGEPQSGNLQIEYQAGGNGSWGSFEGDLLTPTDAIYITRGGRHLGVVWAIDSAHPLPEHGVMLFGGNGYVTQAAGGYVKIVDGVLYDVHENVKEATHLLVIWAGFVRG